PSVSINRRNLGISGSERMVAKLVPLGTGGKKLKEPVFPDNAEKCPAEDRSEPVPDSDITVIETPRKDQRNAYIMIVTIIPRMPFMDASPMDTPKIIRIGIRTG
ncbi:MAG: hypothetical protein ACYDDC_06060, partial [Thermoplasmataceae archaeon]